jgi:SagB-type dehydrogenase family enzyme
MEDAIALPSPRMDGAVSLEAAIAARRSVRSYASTDLTLEEIGQILWAAQGITGDKDHKRAAPSAGGCCPLELYVCRSDGVWHYRPLNHRLVRHLAEDVRTPLAKAAWSQMLIARAPVVFAISAEFARTVSRYGERGRERYVPMDTGHAGQNLLLQAVALGLVSVPVGAFDDGAIARVLNLPSEQEPLYLLPVGHPQE